MRIVKKIVKFTKGNKTWFFFDNLGGTQRKSLENTPTAKKEEISNLCVKGWRIYKARNGGWKQSRATISLAHPTIEGFVIDIAPVQFSQLLCHVTVENGVITTGVMLGFDDKSPTLISTTHPDYSNLIVQSIQGGKGPAYLKKSEMQVGDILENKEFARKLLAKLPATYSLHPTVPSSPPGCLCIIRRRSPSLFFEREEKQVWDGSFISNDPIIRHLLLKGEINKDVILQAQKQWIQQTSYLWWKNKPPFMAASYDYRKEHFFEKLCVTKSDKPFESITSLDPKEINNEVKQAIVSARNFLGLFLETLTKPFGCVIKHRFKDMLLGDPTEADLYTLEMKTAQHVFPLGNINPETMKFDPHPIVQVLVDNGAVII